MDKLRLSICQFDVFWNNPMANFGAIEELTSGLQTDALVLPEMFSTGFAPEPSSLVDPMAIKTKKWLLSQCTNRLLMGTYAVREGQNYFNRLAVTLNQEELITYDKAHTFQGTERQYYQSGQALKVLEHQGWRIGLNVCYDLRFPVWCRAQKADVLIFSANWPRKRIDHWKTLLKARAIENQCYVVGVNRIGTDHNEWNYTGDSLVFDFEGNELLNLRDNEACETVVLDRELLLDYRAQWPFLADTDTFSLEKHV